jgi:ketosteroid isomerase-like protein
MTEVLEQEILAHEEKLTRATQTLDIDVLDRLYADDILMTGVLDSTCTKSAIMDELKRGVAQRDSVKAAGKQFVASYDKEDLKIAVHGDTAVSTYRFVFKVKSDSIDVHRRHRTTNVWMKRQGHWQIVAAHTAFALDARQAAQLAGENRVS